MRPHLLQWFHKKAPKLRQGAPQISRRRDDVRLMMNARSRWCLETPKMKRNREGGETRLGIATAKAAFGEFFGHRQRPSYHILHTYRRIRGQRATEDFSSVRQHSQQRPLRKTVDGEHSTLSHSHDVKFFTQKAKGGNPPTVYWQVRHLVTLTAICFYLFSFESVVF